MPHATIDFLPTSPQKSHPIKAKSKSLPRDLQKLSNELQSIQTAYAQSRLSSTLHRNLTQLRKRPHAPITNIISLGLGSLTTTKDKSRRLKQLAILLALRDSLQQLQNTTVDVYAQDPTFSRADETFLGSLEVKILRTPSGSSLGEAGDLISGKTLVYSPFLTIDAYEQLLVHPHLQSRVGEPAPVILGDDFDALLRKWPKRSPERAQVEGVIKVGLARYRRRAVGGEVEEEGFWDVEDGGFPMAWYALERSGVQRVKARI